METQRLTIDELTRKMNAFVESKGWYAAASRAASCRPCAILLARRQRSSQRPQTPKNLSISLALEAAEIMEHFQWRENAGDQAELASELADVALYLLQLASIEQIDLEQAILDKLELNATREWDTE